ncbi:MAG: DUF1476 domain-containing protein [Pseudomonadota bacterium]
MTTFDDRETAFENKFAHDAELQFRAESIRNRKIAHWAAGLMGKDEAFATEYAKEIIRADFKEPGDADVIAKLVADLAGTADEAAIREKMQDCMAEARKEVLDSGD